MRLRPKRLVAGFLLDVNVRDGLHELYSKPEENLFFDNQLLNYKQTARYLSLSEQHIRRLKSKGQIPYIRIGSRSVRFRVKSLNQWVEGREIK